MRATEMHDLLLACKKHILGAGIWHKGDGQFANIDYCTFCGYSKSHTAQHGHDVTCLTARLERATSVESGCSPNE